MRRRDPPAGEGTVTIRPIREADNSAVKWMWARGFYAKENWEHHPLWIRGLLSVMCPVVLGLYLFCGSMRNPAKSFSKEGSAMLVAEDTGTKEVVGCIALSKGRKDGTVELSKWSVKDSQRRKGTGVRLAREALARAREMGYTSIFATSGSSVTPAVFAKIGMPAVLRPNGRPTGMFRGDL